MLAHSEPVTSASIDWAKGPYWLSPKLDGVRAIIKDGQALSRTLKALPNLHIQSVLGFPSLNGLDGEVVVGSPTHPNCIQATTSGVMSRAGVPSFTYFVFDMWDREAEYRERYDALAGRVEELVVDYGLCIALVSQTLCYTPEEFDAAVAANYEAGYEGSIARCYAGLYKYNRSTKKEAYLLKVKESLDAEIRVTGFVEMQHNDNEATRDERGYTKRTTHRANKRDAGTLGKLIGVDLVSGQEVVIGPGKMTAADRLEVWKGQDRYLGKIAKYRYAKHGVLDAPRFPRFITWRDEIDL